MNYLYEEYLLPKHIHDMESKKIQIILNNIKFEKKIQKVSLDFN